MTQMLLFPDPQPLVERLGVEFFRTAPEQPGVYLMRDEASAVLYVGKAKNLRKRLGSYRVANPDRLHSRHLRLLRAVARIDLEECPNEPSALSRESELLRRLRPRFNRSGTWPGQRQFLTWRLTEEGLDLAVTTSVEPGWCFSGPLGASAIALRSILVRLLWCALFTERGVSSMPEGWFFGKRDQIITIPCAKAAAGLDEVLVRLSLLFDGKADQFTAWIEEQTPAQAHPFEVAVREADIEIVGQVARKIAERNRLAAATLLEL